MSLEFLTTDAIAIYVPIEGNCYINYIWAGDSRGYLLCENELIQITTDGSDEEDICASMNSYAPMNNVISFSKLWNFRGVEV